MAWKSVPLALLVTHRGFLYAFPAGLVLLLNWRRKHFSQDNAKAHGLFPVWIEVLLYSTMPLFHIHTFLFLSMLLGLWIVAGPAKLRVELGKLLGYSFAPAVTATSLVTGMFQSHGNTPAAAEVSTRGIAGVIDRIFLQLHMPFHVNAG